MVIGLHEIQTRGRKMKRKISSPAVLTAALRNLIIPVVGLTAAAVLAAGVARAQSRPAGEGPVFIDGKMAAGVPRIDQDAPGPADEIIACTFQNADACL
jgi:hypothetical protein